MRWTGYDIARILVQLVVGVGAVVAVVVVAWASSVGWAMWRDVTMLLALLITIVVHWLKRPDTTRFSAFLIQCLPSCFVFVFACVCDECRIHRTRTKLLRWISNGVLPTTTTILYATAMILTIFSNHSRNIHAHIKYTAIFPFSCVCARARAFISIFRFTDN